MVDEHQHHKVDAKVVAVDPTLPPVEAEIVADKRDTLGKRLGTLAIVLLVLFFSIGGYVRSAQNGRQLTRAAQDRSELIQSVKDLTRSNRAQTAYILLLRKALKEQNEILREAGFKTVRVPPPGPGVFQPGDPNNPNNPNPQPSPGTSPSSHPTNKPSPKPSRTPTPSPSPTDPVNRVTGTVCELTGVCLFKFTFTRPIFFRF